MRVAFYRCPGNETTDTILNPMAEGIRRHGDSLVQLSQLSFQPDQVTQFDVVFTRGITACSCHILNACLEKKVNVVYCDKAYVNRGWNDKNAYYRFSVNSFHPLDYFQSIAHPPDRWEKLGFALAPRQKRGETIVYASIPQKSAYWHGFDAIQYAEETIQKIRKITHRPVVYRPRKTKEAPPPIPGTLYSFNRCDIWQELRNAFALVTYASNAAVDAILAGVPAFVLGPGIARPVSNTDLSELENPYFPSEEERTQWCCDLAYCQWRVDEIESGEVWQDLKGKMVQTRALDTRP